MGLTIEGGKQPGVALSTIEEGQCFKYEDQFYQVPHQNDYLSQEGDGYLLVYCFDVGQVARVILTAEVHMVNLTLRT